MDEFIQATGYHRKHVNCLLKHGRAHRQHEWCGRPRTHDGETGCRLVSVWDIAGRVSGKRLQPFLLKLLVALERHGESQLDPVTRAIGMQ